jgi:hypothetical protein
MPTYQRNTALPGVERVQRGVHEQVGVGVVLPSHVREVDALRKAPPGTVAHCDNCGAILVP